ncbi:MAG: MFS transporter [Solirubrobacterales bacterium]|nr:MFS transporter [Solirubrobacterales bacterium]
MSETKKRIALVASILGSAIVFLDGTIVNVALPAIRASLHRGLAQQQWVVEAYLLTLASLLLVGGSLGDLFGRRLVFATGLIGFGGCSLLCALTPTGAAHGHRARLGGSRPFRAGQRSQQRDLAGRQLARDRGARRGGRKQLRRPPRP